MMPTASLKSPSCLPVAYRGEVVAYATSRSFFLVDSYERLPDSDPHKRMVLLMCRYAGDVLSGVVPGPYRDERGELYARSALIQRHDLLERLAAGPVDYAELADRYGVPVEQVRLRVAEVTGER